MLYKQAANVFIRDETRRPHLAVKYCFADKTDRQTGVKTWRNHRKNSEKQDETKKQASRYGTRARALEGEIGAGFERREQRQRMLHGRSRCLADANQESSGCSRLLRKKDRRLPGEAVPPRHFAHSVACRVAFTPQMARLSMR